MTEEKKKIDIAYRKLKEIFDETEYRKGCSYDLNLIRFFRHFNDRGIHPGVADLFMVVRQVECDLPPYYFIAMDEGDRYRFKRDVIELLQYALTIKEEGL